MDGKDILWILVALVVLLLIAWFIARTTRARTVQSRRDEAAQLREDAHEQDRALREREAHASAVEARARKAQAEADERAAEAKRLQAEAERHSERADEVRVERDERIHAADARDPDVETEADRT